MAEGETVVETFDPTRPNIARVWGDGLELVPPDVVSVRGWYGGRPAPKLKPRTATCLAGVARKP